ncbi:uncharacterized protein LAESUDRAFT_812447, partial [Laetiporus sulphureus 93-53]
MELPGRDACEHCLDRGHSQAVVRMPSQLARPHGIMAITPVKLRGEEPSMIPHARDKIASPVGIGAHAHAPAAAPPHHTRRRPDRSFKQCKYMWSPFGRNTIDQPWEVVGFKSVEPVPTFDDHDNLDIVRASPIDISAKSVFDVKPPFVRASADAAHPRRFDLESALRTARSRLLKEA